MKRPFLLILIILMLQSCAHVLREDLMKQGTIDFDLSMIKKDPASNKGRLFILGGIVVKTSLTKDGSLIEAVYVPVNSWGNLKDRREADGRFLAIYRNEVLEPVVFHQKREITLAGEFIELRKGKIDDMEYYYPFFEIKEIYLWEKRRRYYDYPYYYRPHYYPHFYFWHGYDD